MGLKIEIFDCFIFRCLFGLDVDGIVTGAVSVRVDPVNNGNKKRISCEHFVTNSVDTFLNSRNWICLRLQFPNFFLQLFHTFLSDTET